MILKQKKYGYPDMITLALKISPFNSIIFLMRNILDALIPTISIFATAYFLNTAISIFNKEAELSAIYLSIALLIGIMLYQALIGRLMKFIDCKRKIYYRRVLVPEILEKIAKLEYRHIENSNTSDLINRVVPNLESKIWEMYVEFLGLINLVVYVSGVLVTLFLQIWWLPLTIMITSIPLMYIAKKAGQQSYNANRDMTKIDRMTNYLSEVMKNREATEERNVYGYSKELNKQFSEQYYFARKHRLKIELMNSIKTKSSGLIITLYSIGVILLLLPVLKEGRMTVGMFIALVGAIFGLVTRLSQGLNIAVQKFVGYREYLKDLTEYLLLDEQPGATALPCKKINFNTIEFKDVCFQYPGVDKQILNKVSFVIENGKHYSFVGVNGAGKTTITKLITGLYTNFEGQILIDGRSICDFSQSEIKGLSSVVYQDFAKYYLTLYDNIAIADLNTDDKRIRIEDAIQLVGLSDVVGKLKNGLDTPLGKIMENGVDLSEGEWQRVVMARSVMNTAPLKILDEPTASLDPKAESMVYNSFEQISQGMTTIFISHRLGSTKLADIIYVLSEGKIIETGSHDTLMAEDGVYAEMFNAQAEWYRESKNTTH